jgi:hypothetical protein
MKIIPGAPEGRTPLWLEPTPYYGPKDQSQDIRGLEMEKKYTGSNLRRYDKLPFEQAKKEVDKKQHDALKAFFDSLDKDKSS